jgi:FkbH-like protein
MTELKYSELLRLNRELGYQLTGPTHRVAVLSNVVLSSLKEVLEFTLRGRGLPVELTFGDYDNVVQESARLAGSDTVLILMELANLTDGLPARAPLLEASQVDALIGRVQAELDLTFQNLSGTRLVLVNSFSPLLFAELELREGVLDRICAELNAHLRAKAPPNFVIVPFDRVIAQLGVERALDERFYYSSKSPYSWSLLLRYSEQIAPAILSAAGAAKKVLIFDCDNTLWKGVLGEDGEHGIRMADGTPDGAPFAELQRLAIALQRSGVLLGLCSKNNPEDVEKVLISHPHMLLRNEHLAIKKVNWTDKAANLRQIAAELNLGLDSIVFVDDSEFELNLIREQLPAVHTLKVPPEPYKLPGLLRAARRLFFNLSRTSEDTQRTELYRQDSARKAEAAAFTTIEDYLRSLDLQIYVQVDDPELLARSAQLTQKTNQFNLTTRRYTEADIQRFLADERFAVVAVRVADKFGDYGITGLAILDFSREASLAVVDTLLMSCRVLGRNVERVIVDELVRLIRQRGAKQIVAEYIPTAKNAQVEHFYDSLGFARSSETKNPTTYLIAAADYQTSGIDYIKVTKDHGRTH